MDEDRPKLVPSTMFAQVSRRAALQLGRTAAALPIVAGGLTSSAAQSPNSLALPRVSSPPENRSVRAFGARGDGVAADASAIQRAIDQARFVQIPEGNYLIDRPIFLRPDTTIEFLGDARLLPADDGITVFRSKGLTPGGRIVNPRIKGAGRKRITAFELESFRNGCAIERPMIEDCDRGIVLKSLCWDLVVMQPTIIRTRLPIVISDRSNAIDIFHPAFDGYETGIVIDGDNGEVTTTRIWGGYIQNGTVGISDHSGIGTLIYGTYFEGNREVDIDLHASLHTRVDATQHYEAAGKAAVRGKRTQGVAVRSPLMSSGGRKIGLIDFDSSNQAGFLELPRSSEVAFNRPLGVRDGLAEVALESSGRFRPQLLGSRIKGEGKFAIAEGRWRISGSDATIDIEVDWLEHSGSGGAVLTDIPLEVQPATYVPRPRAQVISERMALGGGALVAQLNGEGTNISLVIIDSAGSASLLSLPREGRLSFRISYSLAP